MLQPAHHRLLAALTLALLCANASGQNESTRQKTAPEQSWTFAVSGDSRNCGDVVMPAIAAAAIQGQAAFYWHLGDLRAIYAVDEDIQHAPEHRGQTVAKDEYLENAWNDFIHSQLTFFGTVPVFLGIGNHETIPPKTRADFANKFAKWLDAPALKQQRLADNPEDVTPKTYFHWIQGGVDFIYLDNATHDQFSPDQVNWFEGVIQRAAANPAVRSVVVGMHAALPDSLSYGHSMSDWQIGVESGRRVYTDLLNFNKKTHKYVYVLASHSHFYMSGIFASDFWKANGGELPGWIIGTGGAIRYALPPEAPRAREARTKVYGVMLATVHGTGEIDFKFKEIKQGDVPQAVVQRYTPEFVGFCFDKNTQFAGSGAAEKK